MVIRKLFTRIVSTYQCSKNYEDCVIERCYLFGSYNPQGERTTYASLQTLRISKLLINYLYLHIYLPTCTTNTNPDPEAPCTLPNNTQDSFTSHPTKSYPISINFDVPAKPTLTNNTTNYTDP